jgi:hypothetical protein
MHLLCQLNGSTGNRRYVLAHVLQKLLQANYLTQDFKQTFNLLATHYPTPGVGMEFAFKFDNGESV